MRENFKDIKFINIPDNRKVGDVVLDSTIPLPIQFDEGQKAEDISLASLAAGLIRVIAFDTENEHFDYYKKVLLELQSDVVKELNIAAIAKSQKKEYLFALELMLAVNHLCELPETYINLAVLYANMVVDYHSKDDDVTADMYDDKILEVLNQCVKKYPEYAPVYSEISAFHMRHGDMEGARDNLEKFVLLTDDEKAKKAAQKNLDKLSKMLSSKDQVMYAYDKMMMGCSDEAVDLMNKYIAANEPSWEAFFIRGWAKRTLEDFDGAQKDLLEALRIDGKNAEIYNELSICAREMGNIELAKSYLDIASDLDPENTVYLTNLAFLHLCDGEMELCREMIERARTIDPEDPQLEYIIKEYQDKTGDKLGDVITQEIYTDEDFEELHRKEHEDHVHHEEI